MTPTKNNFSLIIIMGAIIGILMLVVVYLLASRESKSKTIV